MTEAGVREALRDVRDPELGVNIVDLGLVYRIEIDAYTARVTMAMTSPACPLRDYLEDLARSAVAAQFPDARVLIEIVTEPPWTEDMMTDAARQQLG
jgi:metal-sulfur cluster biosynthetic enzyme